LRGDDDLPDVLIDADQQPDPVATPHAEMVDGALTKREA
jgi:hypothetical protein